MYKKIKTNLKQRYLFQNFEKKRLIIKILVNNLSIPKQTRLKIQQKFLYFSKNSSLTRIKNICILTGRPRSVYRLFKISRLQFRKYASKGFLSGVSKYSW